MEEWIHRRERLMEFDYEGDLYASFDEFEKRRRKEIMKILLYSFYTFLLLRVLVGWRWH